VALLIGGAGAFAQEKPEMSRTTVLDGVFTEAQAQRGKEAYAVHCSSCHYSDLRGTNGPALKGQPFIDHWREDSAKTLLTFLQTSMPREAPASLATETYVDIFAYILSVNMFPAGDKELTSDVLDSIQIVGPNGPAPIPNFALVTVVGCFVRNADTNEWNLKNASVPKRTRDEKPKPLEVEVSAAARSGTDTFRLVYVDDLRPAFIPEKNIGRKLHATGYLLRNAKGIGLSVTWLESVSDCNKIADTSRSNNLLAALTANEESH
jgi:mono/diheme cytochrome c family protein